MTVGRRSRYAVGGYFALNGLILSSWVPRIPQVRDTLQMSPAVVGGVLLMVALGALVAMPVTGLLVARWGARLTTALSGVAYCGSLIGIGLAGSVAQLAVALLFAGLVNGALDVAMNTLASAVERGAGRVLMPWFHGLFSVGGLLGALLGAGAAGMGIPAPTQFFWVGGTCVLVATFLVRALPNDRVDTVDPMPDRGGRKRGLARALLPFGLVAFVVLLAEGAMADWSAMYLTDEVHASPGLAASGYVVFVLSMATGRLLGTKVTEAFSALRVFRAGAGAMAVGLAAMLLVPSPVTTLFGCLLLGLGISCLFPLLLNRAAMMPGQPAAHAVTVLSVVGYFGFLGGPPAIGLLAEATSLRLALGVLVLAPVLVLAASRVVSRDSDKPSSASAGCRYAY